MKRKPVFVEKEAPDNGWEVGDAVAFTLDDTQQTGVLTKKLFHSAIVTINATKENRKLFFHLNGKTIISYTGLLKP